MVDSEGLCRRPTEMLVAVTDLRSVTASEQNECMGLCTRGRSATQDLQPPLLPSIWESEVGPMFGGGGDQASRTREDHGEENLVILETTRALLLLVGLGGS